MSSYALISRHTDDCWGSSLGLDFVKFLQFTKATSSESSQHRSLLFHQKSWFGTDTSSSDCVNKLHGKSLISTSRQDVTFAVNSAGGNSVLVVCPDWFEVGPFSISGWLVICLESCSASNVPRVSQWGENTSGSKSVFSKSFDELCSCPAKAEFAGGGKSSAQAWLSGCAVSSCDDFTPAAVAGRQTKFRSCPFAFPSPVSERRVLLTACTAHCVASFLGVSATLSSTKLSSSSDCNRLDEGLCTSSFSSATGLFLLFPVDSTWFKLARTSSKDRLTRGKRHYVRMERKGNVQGNKTQKQETWLFSHTRESCMRYIPLGLCRGWSTPGGWCSKSVDDNLSLLKYTRDNLQVKQLCPEPWIKHNMILIHKHL